MEKTGRIEVITGPMFAGKTEELIRRVRRAEFAMENIVVFKPMIDDRYGENDIVSHNHTRTKSVNIRYAKEIYDYIDDKTNVVAIDEVQFLDDEALVIIEDLANRGIKVMVSGLDQNFRGEPFAFMPELLAIADEVLKLTAICVVCHAPATKTQRLVNHAPAHYNDPLIVVGAKENYEARCRKCHQVPGRPKDYLAKKK